MAKNFAEITFSNAVKELQEKNGSRKSYERMEKNQVRSGLTDNEIGFIEDRDSFYMASIGESSFPYIQHRGGPKGFVKVLDSKRIGFIDFKGNMQFISVGNIATNNNVALIMVDYPSKTRLKIYAKAEIVELKNNLSLYDTLNLEDYEFRPDRMMILHIEAFDWNCPQHITARYTYEDVEEVFTSQKEEIARLEAEVDTLKAQLKGR
jgi:uncharacterized protein